MICAYFRLFNYEISDTGLACYNIWKMCIISAYTVQSLLKYVFKKSSVKNIEVNNTYLSPISKVSSQSIFHITQYSKRNGDNIKKNAVKKVL